MVASTAAQDDILRAIFDALPSLVFIVDEDLKIYEHNKAASDFIGHRGGAILKQKGGDILKCFQALQAPEGCGTGTLCNECIIRNSVREALAGHHVVRRRSRLEVISDGSANQIYALISASPFKHKDKKLVLLVIEDLAPLAELREILPICSICNKVRNEEEVWLRLESYFKEYWDLSFSHSLCPECFKEEMKKIKKFSDAKNSPQR